MTQTLLQMPTVDLDDIQHLLMDDASWELYEEFLDVIGNRSIRVTYDDGRMEIMSPLPEHEYEKKLVGQLIEALAFHLRMPRASYGSTTLRRRDKAKGLEPDECYYFHHEKQMRNRGRFNLKKDPPPELAVEVDVTSRSIRRLPIYAALGVPEVWVIREGRIDCLHLVDGKYRPRKMSLAFPFLEPALLQQFVDKVGDIGETAMLVQFQAWVKKNGWA